MVLPPTEEARNYRISVRSLFEREWGGNSVPFVPFSVMLFRTKHPKEGLQKLIVEAFEEWYQGGQASEMRTGFTKNALRTIAVTIREVVVLVGAAIVTLGIVCVFWWVVIRLGHILLILVSSLGSVLLTLVGSLLD